MLHEHKRGFCSNDTLMYELSGTLVICACQHVYIIPLVMLLSQTQHLHSKQPPLQKVDTLIFEAQGAAFKTA